MKKSHVKLTEADKTHLEDLLSKGSLPTKVFKRATGLLELNRGKTYKEVAKTLSTTPQTVSNWQSRYNSQGLASLQDAARSGRPVEFDGKLRSKITALACSDPPEGYARWTLRLLSDKAVELNYCEQLSYSEVHLILKKMNLSLT